jgi:hypothetical protein
MRARWSGITVIRWRRNRALPRRTTSASVPRPATSSVAQQRHDVPAGAIDAGCPARGASGGSRRAAPVDGKRAEMSFGRHITPLASWVRRRSAPSISRRCAGRVVGRARDVGGDSSIGSAARACWSIAGMRKPRACSTSGISVPKRDFCAAIRSRGRLVLLRPLRRSHLGTIAAQRRNGWAYRRSQIAFTKSIIPNGPG